MKEVGLRSMIAPLVLMVLVAVAGGCAVANTREAGPTADVPPVGAMWFGSAFDTTTFAVAGRTSSAATGTTVAFVAHLPRSVRAGEANLWVAVDGQVIGNSALDISGEGELVGATYTLSVPGTYAFTITDIGGNTLASGAVAVTG